VAALVRRARRAEFQPQHAAGDSGGQSGRVADEAGGAFLAPDSGSHYDKQAEECREDDTCGER
jgi:hypothetical protein